MRPDEIDALCDRLGELQYRRRFYTNLINQQHNAGKAMVRRFIGFDTSQAEEVRDKVAARAARIFSAVVAGKEVPKDDRSIAELISADLSIFAKGAEPFEKHRHEIELEMCRIVRKLPIISWQKGVKGFGEKALAAIIGECGDLSLYDNPSKVWKRLGLAPLDGRAGSTWRSTGGLSAQEWSDFGYVGRRRSVVYADVESPLIKHQWAGEKTDKETGVVTPAHPTGPYGEIYGAYKARIQAINADGGYADEAAAAVAKFKKAGKKPLKENVEGRLTPKHINNRALRYMSKKLLADLWSEWRRASKDVDPKQLLPAAPMFKIAA